MKRMTFLFLMTCTALTACSERAVAPGSRGPRSGPTARRLGAHGDHPSAVRAGHVHGRSPCFLWRTAAALGLRRRHLAVHPDGDVGGHHQHHSARTDLHLERTLAVVRSDPRAAASVRPSAEPGRALVRPPPGDHRAGGRRVRRRGAPGPASRWRSSCSATWCAWAGTGAGRVVTHVYDRKSEG